MSNIVAGVPTDSSRGRIAGREGGKNSETMNRIVFSRTTTIAVSSRVFHRTLDDMTLSPIVTDPITELPNSRFILNEPIPVRMEQCEDGAWSANFDEAGIGMPGDDPTDAKEALAENIAYAMETFLSEEEKLSINLRRELAVLRRYIQVVDDHKT
jgi:hypothetical protein